MRLPSTLFSVRVAVFLISASHGAETPRVQLFEIIAGLNGNSRAQAIQFKFIAAEDGRWGPQGAGQQGRAMLVFEDAAGTETGRYVFPADSPVGLPGAGGIDCNLNGVPDSCEIESGVARDENQNGIPDVCESDPRDRFRPFRRGDANADDREDLTDAVAILFDLFGGPAEALPCRRSGDANRDGAVDISDPLAVLNYLFLDGPAPPAPSGACGTDSGAIELSCESFPPCEASG